MQWQGEKEERTVLQTTNRTTRTTLLMTFALQFVMTFRRIDD
jgi:hypothetical protein